MLQRVAPTLYRAQTGETVTIAAIAQNNGGVRNANFRYGSRVLMSQIVQGQPGCEFVVENGVHTFGAVVTFAPNMPAARYDLFEEEGGTLFDLEFPILSTFGAVAQFQVEGVAVPVLAVARRIRAATAGVPQSRKRGGMKRKRSSKHK